MFLLCPNENTRKQLKRFHILDLVPDDHAYSSRHDALTAAVQYINNEPGAKTEGENAYHGA